MNKMVQSDSRSSDAIGSRIARAIQRKKANRRVYNHTPYGLVRVGDQLGRLPHEQAIIQRIKLERANGHALRRIAELLNRDNIPTKLGRRWFAQTVKDVLDNSLNDDS